MSADESRRNEFEQRAGAVLGESVTRVDARVRSRLNQARHAALEEIAAGRRSFWRTPVLMPATGAVAAAALVVALLLTHTLPCDRHSSLAEGGQARSMTSRCWRTPRGSISSKNSTAVFYEWAAPGDESEDGDGTSG